MNPASPPESEPPKFELRRRCDGLVYRFAGARDNKGRFGFLRSDGPFWIIRHPSLGWIAGAHGSNEVFGRPWSMPPSDQQDAPPEGIWVSRKGDASYVYDLVYV